MSRKHQSNLIWGSVAVPLTPDYQHLITSSRGLWMDVYASFWKYFMYKKRMWGSRTPENMMRQCWRQSPMIPTETFMFASVVIINSSCSLNTFMVFRTSAHVVLVFSVTKVKRFPDRGCHTFLPHFLRHNPFTNDYMTRAWAPIVKGGGVR